MKTFCMFALLAMAACAFVMAQDSVHTTPCDLSADPAAYNGKTVTVRSGVLIGFEESRFDLNCENEDLNPIWITFGGDVEIPIIYCCGDHTRKRGITLSVDSVKVPLKKDREFKKFFDLLTAERKKAPTGVPCFYDCYQFHVTATVTGRFFAGAEWHRPDDWKVRYTGYGHLGCCSLFVIQKVTDVESEHTSIPFGDNFSCSHNVRQLPIDRSGVIAKQRAVLNHRSEELSVEELGEKLTKDQLRNTHDDFDSGDTRTDYEGKFLHEKRATYIWLANNKLTSYSITFERFDWLSSYARRIDDRIWSPVKVERSECKSNSRSGSTTQ